MGANLQKNSQKDTVDNGVVCTKHDMEYPLKRWDEKANISKIKATETFEQEISQTNREFFKTTHDTNVSCDVDITESLLKDKDFRKLFFEMFNKQAPHSAQVMSNFIEQEKAQTHIEQLLLSDPRFTHISIQRGDVNAGFRFRVSESGASKINTTKPPFEQQKAKHAQQNEIANARAQNITICSSSQSQSKNETTTDSNKMSFHQSQVLRANHIELQTRKIDQDIEIEIPAHMIQHDADSLFRFLKGLLRLHGGGVIGQTLANFIKDKPITIRQQDTHPGLENINFSHGFNLKIVDSDNSKNQTVLIESIKDLELFKQRIIARILQGAGKSHQKTRNQIRQTAEETDQKIISLMQVNSEGNIILFECVQLLVFHEIKYEWICVIVDNMNLLVTIHL